MLQTFKIHLTIFLIFLVSGKITAQEVVSYSISDGLAHKHITYFLQDRDGYLWIGTWGGLSRYDGHSFTSYNNNPDDTTTITSDPIHKITLDSTGRIWVVTQQGIVKYNNKTDNFQRVYFWGKKSLTTELSMDLCFDKNNKGWLCGREGLVEFDTDLRSVRYFDISDFHEENSQIIPDSSGLWIASAKGILHFPFRLLANSSTITLRDADTYFPFEENNNQDLVNLFIWASSGKFILITGRTGSHYSPLFISDEKTHSLQQIPLPTSTDGSPLFQLTGISNEIAPDRLLLSTDCQKTVVLNLKTRTFEFDDPIQNLFGKTIPSILHFDNHSNIYFGGLSGLFKYSIPQLNFKSWTFEPGKMNSISGMALTGALFKDKYNHLWVGSRDGGLDRIDLRDNSVVNINLPPELSKLSNPTGVFNIIALNDNELLMNIDSVIFRYQIAENRFSFFKSITYHVYKFFKDSKDNLWISDRNCIMIGKPEDNYKTFRSIQLTDFLPIPMSTRDIFEDSKGQIWLACGDGLVKLDVENPKASKIFVGPGSETDPEVFCITETKNGTFWLGTIRSGIYAFDPETEKFTAHFSTNEGLIDNSVNVIFEDKAGNLWMSTWKGIANLNPKTGKIENYSAVNGLPFPEFNTGSDFRDEDGTIYFGGQGGVIAFHPDSLVNFETKAAPGIDAITTIVGVKALDYPLRNGKMVTLPYNENSFSISFSSFDFRNAGERIYRYRLKGAKDEWTQNLHDDLKAEFVGVKPGLYTFELQSSYKGWPWILETATVLIQVSPPPFFQRQGFQILLLVAFVLSLFAIVFLRIRNNNIQKEIEIVRLEKEANQSTLNFLKSQMNPHFYFNTLNAINSYIMQNDIRSANKYLTTFAKLMRDILENSQKEFVTVAEEGKVLEKYLSLQQLRFAGLFDYIGNIDDNAANKKIPPMLLQPFVENSVEYAFSGMPMKGIVQVDFKFENNRLLCNVTDNGIGIEKSGQIKQNNNRKSTAIKNIYSRIEMLNRIYSADISLEIIPANPENQDYPGTTILLSLPDFGKPGNER